MWICLNNAFVSMVAHRNKPGYLMVRARRAGDIERAFPDAEVKRTPEGDYLFRATIHKDEVAKAMVEHIQGIDYDNFKNSVNDRKLHDAYYRIWNIMYEAQDPKYEGLRPVHTFST
jgi:hypothetical protein